MTLRQQDDSQRCGRCGRKLRQGRWNHRIYRYEVRGHAPGCTRRSLPMVSATYPAPLEGEK